MGSRKKVAVIGAGVSGLVSAYELTRLGHQVTVYEQRDEIGGLARSVSLGGVPIERYYHFICAGDDGLVELVQELGLQDKLHWQAANTSYYCSGRLWPFTTPWDILRFAPLSWTSRVRFGLHAMHARGFTDWERLEDRTAREWLIAGEGLEAYQVIWDPLLQMKFGAAASQVSAPWMWHRMHRLSGSRRNILKPEELGYLEGGTRTLLGELRTRIEQSGGTVRTGTPVRAVSEEGGRTCGVVLEEGEEPAEVVISTIPLPVLAEMLPDCVSGFRESLQSVPYSGIACLLALMEEVVTSSFWVNVNDNRAPFNGLVEYTNLNRDAQAGRKVLYIPLYMPVEDPRFVMPDTQLVDGLLSGIAALFPGFDKNAVTDWVVTRDSFAQAVCLPGFARRVPPMCAPLRGLYLTDSTQLYPSDRSVSGTIRLAQRVVRMSAGEEHGDAG